MKNVHPALQNALAPFLPPADACAPAPSITLAEPGACPSPEGCCPVPGCALRFNHPGQCIDLPPADEPMPTEPASASKGQVQFFDIDKHEMLRIGPDGFYVRGEIVPQDSAKGLAVYQAFKEWLNQATQPMPTEPTEPQREAVAGDREGEVPTAAVTAPESPEAIRLPGTSGAWNEERQRSYLRRLCAGEPTTAEEYDLAYAWVKRDSTEPKPCPTEGCALRAGHAGEHCLEPWLLSESNVVLRATNEMQQLHIAALLAELEASRIQLNEAASMIGSKDAQLRKVTAERDALLQGAVFSETIFPVRPEPHNPDNLTPAQVGEGWRLLDEDEVGLSPYPISLKEIEAWDKYNQPAHWEEMFWGNGHDTYRTRLSRAELRAARGLDPATPQPERTSKLTEHGERIPPIVGDVPCDEYDAAGPGAGFESDGFPQCAQCGFAKEFHIPAAPVPVQPGHGAATGKFNIPKEWTLSKLAELDAAGIQEPGTIGVPFPPTGVSEEARNVVELLKDCIVWPDRFFDEDEASKIIVSALAQHRASDPTDTEMLDDIEASDLEICRRGELVWRYDLGPTLRAAITSALAAEKGEG